ncbi:uncharacterized protein BDZ99DRAFT_427605 [Mytilinidion resinicola]|uniref:HypA-like protein n=1 Tax=Mytilinidion resinicola TaxID=574789 RepID=A0A6A6Y3M3_9PEZI|nr:uncharacterized protein BDZ99DRAFT_427605 [Mytilinidion resinicola]KAF2803118.1 hypothetical protein BDZ99DRAFT_427605 [Mytilinidion resinicola]
MATSSVVKLSASQHPEFYVSGITAESAEAASKLLQENHDQHHIFFNESGYHNHIAHHLLTIFALGASPSTLKKQYDANKSYQRPVVALERSVIDDMHDPDRFKSYLGKEKYYRDFLVFFEKEIEQKGWENVLNEYVFAGDERAEDLLVRMYAGFLHPIIHLGFGVEFQQPAIIAEALAQAAIHDTWIGRFLLPAEEAAKKINVSKSKSLVELLAEIQADKKLSTAADWDDGNKIRDGLLKRAPNEMIKYASRYSVQESELDEKVAEMTNTAIYYTSSAQNPKKLIKFDFYYMHCVNASIFFSTFLKQGWLSNANKARILEWKGRLDLAMYASRRSPDLLIDEVTNYQPKNATKDASESWASIFERVRNTDDDGHAAKLVRAVAHGQVISEPYEGKDSFKVKKDMWLKLGNMVIDSVEAGEPRWVRSAGFSQAWDSVPERPRAQL